MSPLLQKSAFLDDMHQRTTVIAPEVGFPGLYLFVGLYVHRLGWKA